MATVRSLLSIFHLICILKSYGYVCPSSQTIDTHLICQIFLNTNIESLPVFTGRNFSDDNYCDWFNTTVPELTCLDDTQIIDIELLDLTGDLDQSHPWPQDLESLDLEQSDNLNFTAHTPLTGIWNWTSIQYLDKLHELDLEGNMFSGNITNEIWNMIVSLSALESLVLTDTLFSLNFDEITVNTPSNIVDLEIGGPNFRGTIDGTFIKRFPNLERLQLTYTSMQQHFNNLDILSNLTDIYIHHNSFTGTIALSNGISFIDDLKYFRMDYNALDGEIEWSLFANKYKLRRFDVNNNSLTGTINWNILGDLYNNGLLDHIDLRDNNFTGYVDYSWVELDRQMELDVDIELPCDPVIHPCLNGIPMERTSVFCYNRTDCEQTCQCMPTVSPTMAPSNIPTTPTMEPLLTTASIAVTQIMPLEGDSQLISSQILLTLLSIICAAFCCIIIGFCLGCIYYRKRLQRVRKAVGISAGMDNLTPKAPRFVEMQTPTVSIAPQALPQRTENTTALPKLPPESKSISFKHGENTPGDSMYKAEGRKALVNYKSTDSEMLYVPQGNETKKGSLKFKNYKSTDSEILYDIHETAKPAKQSLQNDFSTDSEILYAPHGDGTDDGKEDTTGDHLGDRTRHRKKFSTIDETFENV